MNKNFGGLMAVLGVNIILEKGEILGLIGPNGAGKTTIFNLISGYYQPDGGDIFFKKENIKNLKPHQICKRGLVRTFQLSKPFSILSVLENVLLGSFNTIENTDKALERTTEILEFCGLLQKKNFPAKSLTIADKKKLELARALATEPEVLLLDETMAGLNPTETIETINLVKEIWKRGTTIFIVEHIMKVIMDLTSRVIVLNHGEKIAEGPPSEIFKNPSVIRAYIGEEITIA